MSSIVINLEEQEETAIIAETLPIVSSSSSDNTNMIKFVFSPTVSDGQELISAEEKIDRTGLLVWRGARVFYEYLYSSLMATMMTTTSNNTKKQSSPSNTATKMKNNSRIVELGAGIGFGSVVAGSFLKSLAVASSSSSSFFHQQHEIICTDFFEPALELAQQQIRVNKLEDSISTVLLDWCWALSEKDEDRQQLDAFISRHIVDTTAVVDAQQPHHFIVSTETDDENKNTPFLPSSSVSSSRNLTLLALDCCYPDTRNDVLCGLFVTIGKLLKMKQTQDEFLTSSSCSSSSPHLIMTFVERDVGLTLRRLIIAASLCGLQVDPLELPILASPDQEREMFTGHTSFCCPHPEKNGSVNSSLSIQDLLLGEDFVSSSSLHFQNNDNDNNIDDHISSIWSILQESFLKSDTSDNKKKSTFATSNASWILRIKLAPAATTTTDGTTCHRNNFDHQHQQYLSHEGTYAIAQNCSRVIEMLTNELSSSSSSSSSPDAETDVDGSILQTLTSEEYLLAKSHFNSKWFAVFPYLCYRDSYAAARSIVAVEKINRGSNIQHDEDENKHSTKCTDDLILSVTEDFELCPRLLTRVLAERRELESDDWMRQISELF